jgi:hypothetical protein
LIPQLSEQQLGLNPDGLQDVPLVWQQPQVTGLRI